MNSHSRFILILAFATSLLFVAIFYFLYRDQIKGVSSVEVELKGDLPVSTVDESKLRDWQITKLLAEENQEQPASTKIQIEKASDTYVRGKVMFETAPKKNGKFLVRFIDYRNEWETVFNQIDGRVSCDSVKVYGIPEDVVGDEGCDTYERTEGIRVAKGWKLISGDPKINCSEVVYGGNVEVRGWYEWQANYVGKEWMLAMSDEDHAKVLAAWPWKTYFNLENVSPKIEGELLNASRENPVILTLKKFKYYCEGSPALSL